MAIRHKIAERLLQECHKRDISIPSLSKECNISEATIKAYLEGKKEISISEVKLICDALNVNATRLLFSKNYPNVRLSFRNTASKVKSFASEIEDVFLLIQDSLPNIIIPKPKYCYTKSKFTNRKDLITEAASLAKEFKVQFPSPIQFLEAYSIPVLPIVAPEINFDAFLLRANEKVLLCLNYSRSASRILFSLAHEVSHLIYDRNISVPVDSFLPNFYYQNFVKEEDVPEFFAYKFAQFYLVPFECAYHLTRKWPELDLNIAQDIIIQCKSSKEVLACAITDALNFQQESNIDTPSEAFSFRVNSELSDYSYHKKTSVSYIDVFRSVDTLRTDIDYEDLFLFLKECKRKFSDYILNEKYNLSEEVYNNIRKCTFNEK